MAVVSQKTLGAGLFVWQKLTANARLDIASAIQSKNPNRITQALEKYGQEANGETLAKTLDAFLSSQQPQQSQSSEQPPQKAQGIDLGGFGSRDSGFRGEDLLVTQDHQRQKDVLQARLNALKDAEQVLQEADPAKAPQERKAKAREDKEKILTDIANSLDAKTLLENQHQEFEKGLDDLRQLSERIDAKQITKDELRELGIEDPEAFQKELKTFTEQSTTSTKDKPSLQELKNSQIQKLEDPTIAKQFFSEADIRKRVFQSGKTGEAFENEMKGILERQQNSLRQFQFDRLNHTEIKFSTRAALVKRRSLIRAAAKEILENPATKFAFTLLRKANYIYGIASIGNELAHGDFSGAARDTGQTLFGYGANRLVTNMLGRLFGLGGGAEAGAGVAGAAGAAEAAGGVALGAGAVAAAPEAAVGIGAGAIIAIVVGIILIILLLFLVLFIILFKQGIGNGSASGATLGVQRTIELTQGLMRCETVNIPTTTAVYGKPNPDCIRHLQLSGPPDAARAALDNLAGGAGGNGLCADGTHNCGELQCGVFIYSAVDYAQWPSFPGAHTVEDWFINYVLPHIFPGAQFIADTISGYSFINNHGQTTGPNAIAAGDIIIYGPGQPGHISFVTSLAKAADGTPDHFHFTVAEANFQSGVAKFRTTELDHHIGSETIMGWWRKKL